MAGWRSPVSVGVGAWMPMRGDWPAAALVLDPEHALAHQLLGHASTREGWVEGWRAPWPPVGSHRHAGGTGAQAPGGRACEGDHGGSRVARRPPGRGRNDRRGRLRGPLPRRRSLSGSGRRAPRRAHAVRVRRCHDGRRGPGVVGARAPRRSRGRTPTQCGGACGAACGRSSARAAGSTRSGTERSPCRRWPMRTPSRVIPRSGMPWSAPSTVCARSSGRTAAGRTSTRSATCRPPPPY